MFDQPTLATAVPGLIGTRPSGALRRMGANSERIGWGGEANR